MITTYSAERPDEQADLSGTNGQPALHFSHAPVLFRSIPPSTLIPPHTPVTLLIASHAVLLYVATDGLLLQVTYPEIVMHAITSVAFAGENTGSEGAAVYLQLESSNLGLLYPSSSATAADGASIPTPDLVEVFLQPDSGSAGGSPNFPVPLLPFPFLPSASPQFFIRSEPNEMCSGKRGRTREKIRSLRTCWLTKTLVAPMYAAMSRCAEMHPHVPTDGHANGQLYAPGALLDTENGDEDVDADDAASRHVWITSADTTPPPPQHTDRFEDAPSETTTTASVSIRTHASDTVGTNGSGSGRANGNGMGYDDNDHTGAPRKYRRLS